MQGLAARHSMQRLAANQKGDIHKGKAIRCGAKGGLVLFLREILGRGHATGPCVLARCVVDLSGFAFMRQLCLLSF